MHFDDASKALVELAASRHNAFHTLEAAANGIPRHRLVRALHRGELTALRPKVWAITTLGSSREQTLRAATLGLGGSAACGRSAAWLHGWLEHPPPVPELWIPYSSRTRLSGVTLRRSKVIDPGRDIVEVDHIRTLNKASTLVQLGSAAPPLIVERCLDEFLRSESGRWLEETMDRQFTPHAKGPRTLAAIIDDPRRVRGVTDSWIERVTAKLIATPWMHPVELQHRVVIEGRTFLIDVAVPDLLLGIEAHGRSFHWGPGKEDADNVRDLMFGTVGWKLVYVTWSQLLDPDEFVRLFLLTACARAEQLGVGIARTA